MALNLFYSVTKWKWIRRGVGEKEVGCGEIFTYNFFNIYTANQKIDKSEFSE